MDLKEKLQEHRRQEAANKMASAKAWAAADKVETANQAMYDVLHYYLDLTIEDTATALGISFGTTKSRLNRAMAKLRLALQVDTSNQHERERTA